MPAQHIRNFLSIEATARKLGIYKSTLYRWINKNLFPPPIKIGKRSFYPKETVRAFFEYIEKEGEIKSYWWKKHSIPPIEGEEGEGEPLAEVGDEPTV